MAKSRHLLTRREFAKQLEIPFSLLQSFMRKGVIRPATGLMPSRVPRIDLRLFYAEYGTRRR
jgi:hypothetical protein